MATTKKDKGALEPTTAIHARTPDGALHLVDIENLRVVLRNDDGSWFAQGLEIDYFAQGNSREDVRARFERGLEATIDDHLETFGTIDRVLKPAPADVRREAKEAVRELNAYSTTSTHTFVPELTPFYPAIQYYSGAEAA